MAEELEIETEDSAPKERKKFRLPRFYYVIGVILIGFVVLMVLHRRQAAHSSLGTPPSVQPGNPNHETSAEADQIIKHDQMESNRALHDRKFISQGGSFMPTLTKDNSDPLVNYAASVNGDTHGNNLPSGNGASAQRPPGRHDFGQTNQAESNNQAPETMTLPQSPKEQKRLLAAIKREMSGNQGKQLPGMLTVKARSKKSQSVNGGGASTEMASSQSGAATPPSQSSSQTSGRVLVHTGQLLYAVNDLKADSNGANFVQATVQAGRYVGAELQGSFKKLQSDRLELTFKTLSWHNHTYRINAVGVNPNSPQIGLASEVDHHYLERFGGLFLTSALSAVGQSLQQQGTTATYGGFGGTSQTTVPTKTPLQMGLIGLGGVANGFANMAQKAAAQGPTVILAANTPIGVLFRSDWKASAPSNAENSSATGASSNSGPTRLPYLPPANQVFSGD